MNINFKHFLAIFFCLSSQYLQAQQLTYISDGQTTYLTDLETCETQPVSSTNVIFQDIAYSPVRKKLYGIGSGFLWEIDMEHDSIIYIMDAPNANALTCDKNGLFYCAAGYQIFALDIEKKERWEVLSLDDEKSDGDFTFYLNELYLSVRDKGLIRINLVEEVTYTNTNIAAELDSIYGMITEFGACEEGFYLMAHNDIYRLDKNMSPVMHCEDIIENYIWGAASNTEVLSDFELQMVDKMALCENDIPLEIDASEYAANYLWNDGTTEPTLPVYQKGKYWVDVTVGKCTKRDTVEVFFQPTPTVEFGEDQVLCEGQVYKLDAENEGGIYTWQDGSEQSYFDVVEEGQYVVEVSVNGCANSDTIKIDYYYCEPRLEMPNVVTPKFDGVNDQFVPIEIENIDQMKTSVYNRWGNKVFETEHQSINWSPAQNSAGPYYYVINYSEYNGQNHLKKGWVQVLK